MRQPTLTNVAAVGCALLLCIVLTACEKAIVAESGANVAKTDGNVTLRLRMYEQSDFTRAATDVANFCSRLNIAVFSADGAKVNSVSQKQGDSGYGTVTMLLPAGTYNLVVIAHNGNGSATISSTEKVTFANNKVTDTFYYYGELVVTGEQQSIELTLQRAVAMFRLVMTDETVPENVHQLKFYYVGGSSTFSPATGFGCVESKQTEYREVNVDGIYEIYSMPHSEVDELTKLTVTALDANDNAIREMTFENIPITRNKVTSFTGAFFGGSTPGGPIESTLSLKGDPEWGGISAFTF